MVHILELHSLFLHEKKKRKQLLILLPSKRRCLLMFLHRLSRVVDDENIMVMDEDITILLRVC